MTIRTPDDERPDWLYAPFREGWWYQGATYPGHSDFSVDWNRRTRTGGWLDDTGDPVLAAQDGTVADVDPREGLVMLHHHGGLTQTEYRHMTGPFPKVGDRVKRGDRIGSIGNVAGDGRSFGAHLHHVHYRRPSTKVPFQRVPMTIEGKRLPVSVESDAKPASWKPPTPVMLQGPPPPATWQGAFRDAEKALDKAENRVATLTTQVGALTDERNTARAEATLARQAADELRAALTAAAKRITEMENAAPDCVPAVNAERGRVLGELEEWIGEHR